MKQAMDELKSLGRLAVVAVAIITAFILVATLMGVAIKFIVNPGIW